MTDRKLVAVLCSKLRILGERYQALLDRAGQQAAQRRRIQFHTITKDESEERPVETITVRIKNTCRMTGIGRSKVYELIKTAKIEALKVGAITLIPEASIRLFLVTRGMIEERQFCRPD